MPKPETFWANWDKSVTLTLVSLDLIESGLSM